MSKVIAGPVTKMWFSKLRITSFWTQILHLNFKENVGGQEYALQHGGQYKSYYFVEKSKRHKISPLNVFPLKFQV